jgi:hypothetical protein
MESLRNTSTVLFTLLLCWSVPSYSETVTYLDVECQIKDQTVLGVIDGKPQTYNGVEDSYKVGDFLTVKLFSFSDPPKMVVSELKWVGKEKSESFSLFTTDDLEIHSDKKGGVVPNKVFYLYFKEDDEINIDDNINRTEIKLRRYYKSDWDGFIVNGPTFGTQHFIRINSVDCRTKTNNLMDLLPYGKPSKVY